MRSALDHHAQAAEAEHFDLGTGVFLITSATWASDSTRGSTAREMPKRSW